jgi:uncharacterized protein (TIGR03435 family)
MMQSLLADRFHLAIHFENREAAVLALTLDKPGKLGPNIHPHAEGPACDRPDAKGFSAGCHAIVSARSGSGWITGSRDNSMEVIAQALTSLNGSDHPLIDQTGLPGNYDFFIKWSPASTSVAASEAGAAPDPEVPTFIEALHEQLGMKIVPTRAPLQFLIIDHIERPSEN